MLGLGDIFQEWKSFLYLFVTMFLGWIGWSLKKRFVPREDHDQLVLRVAKLESAIELLPSAKEINALRGQLADVSSELKVFNQRHIGMSEQFSRLQRQVDRIEHYLMEQKK